MHRIPRRKPHGIKPFRTHFDEKCPFSGLYGDTNVPGQKAQQKALTLRSGWVLSSLRKYIIPTQPQRLDTRPTPGVGFGSYAYADALVPVNKYFSVWITEIHYADARTFACAATKLVSSAIKASRPPSFSTDTK